MTGGPAARDGGRRFRAFGVGLAKTGTTSLCGIFGGYRAAHEYDFAASSRCIGAYAAGRTSRTAFRAFVRRRDRTGRLELDAASFHVAWAELLVRWFPEATYLFTYRDCCSWLESLLGMLLTEYPDLPPWLFALCRAYAIPARRPDFSSPDALQRALPRLLDPFLDHWDRGNRFLLRLLPPGNTLVVATTRLGPAVPRLAEQVGVPARALRREAAHLHQATRHYRILHALDPAFLEARVRSRCGPLMEALFPGFGTSDFLQGERAQARVPVGPVEALRAATPLPPPTGPVLTVRRTAGRTENGLSRREIGRGRGA